MLPTSQEIGRRMKELRGDLGMAEVAQALGVSRQAYWKYEAGEIVPSDEMKVKIAQYFHVSVNMLFFTP
ncbi:MAG: helix-turn-helix transcriptional regulator [Lachnospiraceae bacterium]